MLDADGAKQPLPHGPLNGRLQARIVYERSTVRAPNVIAKLPGGDAALKNQYVLLSAHLDHTGVGDLCRGAPVDIRRQRATCFPPPETRLATLPNPE